MHGRYAQIARRANLPQPDGIAVTPKSAADFALSLPHQEGALRDRHERWERDAVDAEVSLTSDTNADGEVVWS